MRAKKEINVEIGFRIQQARERSGYTQEELSEIIGVTPNHLSAIERGASGISLESLQKLCRSLGISADSILFGTVQSEIGQPALAEKLSMIDPKYQKQFDKIIAAFLEITAQ